ncbi:MAG: hypothetical protein HZB76_03180 [Chlamydiae bacterium]|nr:hypothetical protein [Chlamydiota bacterium]
MDLIEKIRKIEALLAQTQSEGERQAAQLAKERLQGKLEARPIEYTVRMKNMWMKKLFVALCQKYQLKTYRYARQKYTTSMVWVSSSFMNEVLWPEYIKYSNMFQDLADQMMQDLVSKIHDVKEEDEEIIMGEIPSQATSH